MYITWHGLGCVRIQSKETTVLIDPFATVPGLTTPRLQADILAFSSEENPLVAQAAKSQGFVLSFPGEYEVAGVVLKGTGITQTVEKKSVALTLFTFGIEDVVLGHLANLNRALTDEELEHMNDVDVLLLPVGGKSVLNAEKALEVVAQIEPRLVIPFYYKVRGLKMPLDDASEFLKEMGAKNLQAVDKLRLTRKELPEGDMQAALLTVP